MSHFLEHLNFKRTPTRSIFDIEKETENKGLNLNAFTTRDCTTFIVNQTDTNFFEGLDLVSDMVANSLYTHEDTENEKSTIYSEVKNMHGNPWNTLAETSHFATYRNHQLGLPILGQVDNIERITSDMVKQYHRGNYHGDNIVVACAGGLEHKEIVDMAKQCFKTIAPTPSHMKNRGPTPANFTPGYMWINQHELGDSVYSIMNFEAPGFMSPDYVGFLMLANLIGEADSSMGFMGSIDPQLAFQNVGPKLNLIKNDTYFKGCYLPYEETGLFTLFLNSPIENAREAETLLLAYIEDLLLTVDSDTDSRSAKRMWREPS